MDHGGDTPPYWSHPHRHHRRRSPSPFLNPVALILAISILLLLLLLFIVPPLVSHANQLLRPNSVKKSLDSFNVLLVLFAVLCGVFGGRKDESASSSVDGGDRTNSSTFSNISNYVNEPRQHSVSNSYEFHDRKEYNTSSVNEGGARMKRSTSSYPDLRKDPSRESENRFKFHDDYEMDFYKSPPRGNLRPRVIRRISEAVKEEDEAVIKEIPVDKVEISSSLQEQTPKSSPSQLASDTNLKKRRSSHSVPRQKEVEKQKDEPQVDQRQRNEAQFSGKKEAEKQTNEAELSETQLPNPPPAPPPPSHEPRFPEAEIQRLQKKKSGTKELATAIASLYKGTQRRKRKKKVKERDIYENAEQNSPPPPPPPPPPPSKVLHNLFKKSSKGKRAQSVPTTVPPPPPLPPNSIFINIFNESKRFQPSSKSRPPPPPPPPPSSILNPLFNYETKSQRHNKANSAKPPKPPRSSSSYKESVIIAPLSPLLIPMPPPPPPPHFRKKEVKFVAKGDFVRIKSFHSSRSSSPELEDYDVVSVKTDGGDSIVLSSTSCPSPDVNMKAASFIARLKDEWRLEKINSIKQNRNLG